MACQLIRDENGNDGCFGTLTNADTGHKWQTAELSWLDNEQNISCIPPGIYDVVWSLHPKHGWCYEVQNVPGRTAILIHPGNWAGSQKLGERSDFLGCIGLGKVRLRTSPPGTNYLQESILHSKDAVAEFVAEMKEQPFKLCITNEFQGA